MKETINYIFKLDDKTLLKDLGNIESVSGEVKDAIFDLQKHLIIFLLNLLQHKWIA